ncbi:MAG: NAD(P)H-binding protein [Anaerolineae bacterium]|jgi:uncharacterized protein YbjT (DUF2867 family)|nr:NAD(P)H-binding protein [Anaerolineae bacterium]
MQQVNRVLVTGGTGKTGRRVVQRLHDAHLPVRAGSRSGTPPFNWQERATWAAALQDIDTVYITYQPDFAVPGAADDMHAFSTQAVAAGVRRLVLLSGRGEDEAQRCEQIIQQAGVEWVIVRASWFNQNFDESFLLEPIIAGQIALPVTDVKEPFVDADDIADVVTAALIEDRHVGEVYELSGPRLLTFPEAVAEIAGATGRDLQFMSITPEQYTGFMRAGGVPEESIWLVNYLFTTVLDGRNATLTDGVPRSLGRAPRDFREYARLTAARGVWHNSLPRL